MRFPAALIFAGLLAIASYPGLAATSTLEVTAHDGVKLKATHYSPGKPGPGVLLLHMCNSDRSAWSGLGRLLAARGIHALALDYRGYGASGGPRDAQGEAARRQRAEDWPRDFDAALEALRSRPGVDGQRLGAGGGSCGVNNAVQLARRHPGEVQVLALLAGSTDQAGHDFLGANPWLPVLAVASRDDGQAVTTTRWTLGYSSHGDNRFLEYEAGGHGTELFAVHKGLEPALADWFEQHLIEKPVARPAKFEPRPGPSAEIGSKVFARGGAAQIRRELRTAKSRGETVPLPPEGVINVEGYRLLGEGEIPAAMELFHLNVEAFPRSANALDSLGDAYKAAGQPAKAAEYARKAIAAIPGDPEISEAFAAAVRESAESKLETPGAP